MTPLPDRTVLLLMAITLGVVAALVFWSVRLQPTRETPLLWKESPGRSVPAAPAGQPKGTLL
ncbi:hypothetical protein FQK07_06995 [Synechococcus sp. BSF8S]|uniref:hypothetical protein n=1 Tax=Synechococcales TaxID=1890424 RepID=UPI0016282D5B|nr:MULTISPECIES: hypothetical protein [unclassified Synechococcus]MBC1261024.1 hypothetical protein [Synechococcus sp. BSF8S]MBC1263927.1 hypothetical protein [Synechococcus sp. BSA11S]